MTFEEARATCLDFVLLKMMGCYANIIIAGPPHAGKKTVAEAIKNYRGFHDCVSHVTILSQESYRKPDNEIEDTPYGEKNIDAKSAFDTEQFVKDVQKFFVNGSVVEGGKNRKILDVQWQRKVNIIVGPHAIELLNPEENNAGFTIPNVGCIYLTTTHDNCMQRRPELRYPHVCSAKKYKEYSDFLREQNKREIEVQRYLETTDLVVQYR